LTEYDGGRAVCCKVDLLSSFDSQIDLFTVETNDLHPGASLRF
jgi:hypothetical protein